MGYPSRRTMGLKIIAILLVVCAAISAKNLGSKVFPPDSGEYDEDMGWLFDVVEKNEEREEKTEYNVCQTDACKILGKEFTSSMNTSVDPCENFYDFVCGAWKDRVDLIPPYAESWGRPHLFQYTVYKRIKDIMETEPEPTDILPVRQAKKWYGACMDQDEREKRGIKPIESILIRTGGWPITMDLAEWSEDDFSWQKVERDYFHMTGEFSFYDIEPSWRMDDNGLITKIMISRPKMPLSGRLPYGFRNDADDDDCEGYAKLLKRIVKVFIKHSRADVSGETIDSDIKALVKFEKELNEIKRKDEESEQKTVGEFLADYNANLTDVPPEAHIDFYHLFQILLDMGGIELTDDQKISVLQPGYYIRVTKLLQETPKRTIANYIHWKFVSKVIFYTTEEMETIWNEERQKDDETPLEKPPMKLLIIPWLQCVQELKLTHATSYAFATKYFTNRTEKIVSEMIENIRKELHTEIGNANWLNDEAKDILKDKLNSMQVFMGFPDWYRNKTAVRAAYKGLKVGYDYFDNVLNFEKYKIREQLRFMKEKKEESPWYLEPTIVNAAYNPEKNIINVPAADFQPPLFTEGLPDVLNYGIIGSVIGHEIGHGYDDRGIKYSKNGNETELSNQMIDNYYKRAECFLHQYNNYWGVTEPVYEGTTPEYPEPSIGRQTRGENIADTTGIYSVFKAWKKVRAKKDRGEDRLPGLEQFTDEQTFFIGFASVLCSVERPEYLEEIKADVHSISNIRVMGAVSNSKEFARIFNCPKGSPMNPENKCNIWKRDEENNEISSRHRLHGRKRRHRGRWSLNGW